MVTEQLSIRTLRLIFWLAVGGLVLVPDALIAQLVPRVRVQQRGALIMQDLPVAVPDGGQLIIGGRILAPGMNPAAAQEGGSDSTEKFPNGGTLSTNPDVEGILEKADRYLQEGNFRAASRFWQAAMKQAGDTLFTADGEFYFPLIRRIETIIAGLPADGLEVYRVSADAEAAGYLAEGKEGLNQRLLALQKVVDFAFLSSQGDDAALELATIYLDRFEAFSAEALLRRIIEVYPNPDVSMSEVWLKLAVAKAMIGDHEAAQAAIKELKANQGDVSDSLIGQVELLLEGSDPTAVLESESTGNWTSSMGLGGSSQRPAELNAGFFDESLAAVWMYRQQLREWTVGPRDIHVQGTVERDPLGIAAKAEGTEADSDDDGSAEDDASGENAKPNRAATRRRDTTRASIEREWENNDWQSASMPLVVDGNVIFKSQADLSVWSSDLDLTPKMRSLWLNRYSPDSLTYQILNQTRAVQANYPGANRLKFNNLETMQFFGDQLFQSMMVHNGVIYSIEGIRYDRDDRMPSVVGQNVNIWNAAPTRDRQCFLAAYDLSTGKTLWNQPFPASDEPSELTSAAVLGPPVGYHDTLIVPLLAGGRYFAAGLEARTGKLLWKQTICDSPSISGSALTMVQIAVAGNDVFMTCGCGVLAKLDASTGQLRWVRRYERSINDSSQLMGNQRVFGLNRDWLSKEVVGWQHDLVAVWGPWVVMAASDFDGLVGFDRGTGKFGWMAPRSSVLGCTVDQWLGMKDGIVYAMGPHGLLAYELAAEGRLYGTPQRFDGKTTGRGLVMERAIVLPMGNHLQLFDVKTLHPIRGVAVSMPGDELVGTIVSDGKRLWSAAMGMLVALEPIAEGEATEGEAAEGSVPKKEGDDEPKVN